MAESQNGGWNNFRIGARPHASDLKTRTSSSLILVPPNSHVHTTHSTRPGTCRPAAPGRPAAARRACSSRSDPRARPARAAAPHSAAARRTAGRRRHCAAPPCHRRAQRGRCCPPAQTHIQPDVLSRKWQTHSQMPTFTPTRGARLHARRRAAVGRHQRGAAAHVEQRRMLGRHDLGVERRSIGSLSRPRSTAAPQCPSGPAEAMWAPPLIPAPGNPCNSGCNRKHPRL